MKQRIGIYPGSFDPIHAGHLAFAQEAKRACALSKVVFLPERRPRGKDNVTDIVHRIALIKRAIANTSNLDVAKLGSGQFTVKGTLPEIRRLFGGSHLTLLLGSDTALTLPHWEGHAVLLSEVSLAIGIRAGDNPDQVKQSMTKLGRGLAAPADYTLISAPKANVTSSQIRDGTADMSHLHPDMLDYIKAHQLYTQSH